ncbi:HTH_Tnp_Tc3_2 domain-containing protein [Trichonephila clavipes]|nr:HTH_Tnp_Tc3_2 domain-containing protein [Trichonephila clavipes]
MTIHRWLIERNLRSYRPLHYLQLMPAHCQTRLQWYLARSSWNQADWGRMVFSDESRFQLRPDDHQRRVWRHPGKSAEFAFTIAYHTAHQPRVMVWGAISFENWISLVVIRGTLEHNNTSTTF